MSLPKNTDHGKTVSRVDLQSDVSAGTAIACLLTGVGRSAIAVIGLEGHGAATALETCFVPATERPFVVRQIRYGTWVGSCEKTDSHGNLPNETRSGPIGESIVVIPLSDQRFEIHCHGGVAATTRILDDLQRLGVSRIHASGWHADEPLVIREAKEVLSRCLTARTAALALDQVRGALLVWCEQALCERDELRGPDELWGSDELAKLQSEARDFLAFADLGQRLGDRFHVVLAGPPNVGKSSLINAIVGYDRSITMNVAGTTRDVLHCDTVIDGIPIRLSDTAGIRIGADQIERAGIERAKHAAESADLVVWVNDVTAGFTTAPTEFCSKPSIQVLNKADLLVPGADRDADRDHLAIRTVATTGNGVPKMMTAICDSLVAAFPPPGTAIPLNARQKDCLARIASRDTIEACHGEIRELLGR